MTVAGKRYVECSVLGAESTADAEDSSYDSDYDTEDPISSGAVHSQAETQVSSSSHPEVSRTTSDTLAAEFAEYVTVQGPTPTHSPGYMARVEFALKLGYTERLVQAALQKLGPDPGQNELLAELIKLGASTPQLNDDVEEAEVGLEADLTNDEGGGGEGGGGESGEGSGAGGLRPVVIDGSNVAMSHGNKEVFSCRGIKICVDWFKARGHKEITVFVPKWRKEASRPDNPIADQEILGELERDRLLVFTPSRLVGGKRMVCYDDRYILRLAAEVDGIVVSNDNYRDLAQESPEFRRVVEERILMYSFVNDRFMPPDDPLGRSGPTLENFLKIGQGRTDPAPLCPYAKKCTYGNKCKFRHPERGPHPQKSVTERLVEHAQRHLQARAPSLSLPLPGSVSGLPSQHQPHHKSLCKSRSATTTFSSGPTPTVASVGGGRSAGSGGRTQYILPVAKGKPGETMTDEPAHEQQQQQQATALNPQGYRSCGWQTARSSNPEPEPANMHRKLQRQLTLNPAYDPRLRYLQPQNLQASSTRSPSVVSPQQQSTSIPVSSTQHRPRGRYIRDTPVNLEQVEEMLNRTEAARRSWLRPTNSGSASGVGPGAGATARPEAESAGESGAESIAEPRAIPAAESRVGSGPCARLGSEREQDPRLGGPNPRLHWAFCPILSNMPDVMLKQFYDIRTTMYSHLVNIFPEEEVKTAMMIYPFETDATEICETLLKWRRHRR